MLDNSLFRLSWPGLSVCLYGYLFLVFFHALDTSILSKPLFLLTAPRFHPHTDPTPFSCSHFFQVSEYTQFCRVVFSLLMILHPVCRPSVVCEGQKRGQRGIVAAAGGKNRHHLRPLSKEPTASYRSEKIKQNSELQSRRLLEPPRLGSASTLTTKMA